MAVKRQVLLSAAVLAGMGVLPLGLGSNGAGKSSLLAALTAAIPPAAGAIRFDGRPLAGRRPHEVTHLGIALVPEGRRVYKDMSVQENLEMGAFPKRARGRLKETLDHVVQLFPILGQRRDQPAGTLSGGEQQMLAIGRALMSRPRLLLVDEHSLGLAPMITQSIYRSLSALGADITILLVEQNVEQALNFSRRAYILESGRITRSGRSSELLQDADIRRAYLGL
ncbi:MAG TPA: ABC transporter ATP-binding protein [Desulfobacterales bacterium]|nr:ABC transporter ATP-binding protein [Desulfobacterales bacterium]